MTLILKEELKTTLVETGLQLLAEGLTVGTWGNFSIRDPQTGLIYITPSGMDYRLINNDDIVVLDPDLQIVDGHRVPSIEREMHVMVYKARPDVNAVVHTHPLYSTVLGVNRMDLPGVSEDFAQIVGDRITCSEYALPGTKELARNVVKALGTKNAVLLPNHGALCVGASMPITLTICHLVEKSAHIYIMAKSIGTPHLISPEDILAMQDYAKNVYGQR